MDSLFLVLQFIFAVVLTIAVLLQKSSSIGLARIAAATKAYLAQKDRPDFWLNLPSSWVFYLS